MPIITDIYQRSSRLSIMAQFIRVFSLCLLAIYASSGFAGMPPQMGAKAPDWILAGEDGRHISFYDDSDNQTAVVLFWTTSCPYCQALMPELEKLRRELHDKPIRFYALNIWENGDAVAHMKERDYGFALFLHASNIARLYGVIGTPGLFVIGPDKIVRYVRSHGDTPQQAITHVRQALAGD